MQARHLEDNISISNLEFPGEPFLLHFIKYFYRSVMLIYCLNKTVVNSLSIIT